MELTILNVSLGHSFVVGEAVFSINDLQGNQVKIAIDAPRHITIHREEIYRRIQAGEPKPSGRKTLTLKHKEAD